MRSRSGGLAHLYDRGESRWRRVARGVARSHNHASIPKPERKKAGIDYGGSVCQLGIEYLQDLLEALKQGLDG